MLLRGVLESNEVQIPTTFIVFNKKITKDMIRNQNEYIDDINKEDDDKNKELHEESKKSVGFLESLMNYTQSLTTKTEKSLHTYFGLDKLYFYLVDEVTMQPIIPERNQGPYPIEISQPGEFLPSIAPFLLVGLQVVSAVNLLSGIVRCFGYPVPYISSETMDTAYQFIGNLNEENSVAGCAMMSTTVIVTAAAVTTAAVVVTSNQSKQKNTTNNNNNNSTDDRDSDDDSDSSTTSNNKVNKPADESLVKLKPNQSSIEIKEQAKLVRGAALRQLQNFLLQNDTTHNFCGLRRVITPTGQCIW